MPDFYDVSVAIADCKAIAFDTCHKIYVLMDNAQVEKMREYGYADEPDTMFTKDQMNSQQMLDTVKKWYENSCALRFVQAIETVPEGTDPSEGFTELISQFDEDTCDDCGETGCRGVCNDYDDEPEEEEDDE